MKQAFTIASLSLIISLLLLSGCTETQTAPSTQSQDSDSTGSQPSADPPKPRSSDVEYIGNFVALVEDEAIEARFSLFDSSKDYVSADGTADVRIENAKGEEVYTDTIHPKEEDFGMYTLRLTGEDFKAYVWEIPLDEVEKSTSSSGTMYIEFSNDEARFEELDTDLWGLPTYDEEELAELNEQEFQKNAISINKRITQGSFEVTVWDVGFFEPLETYGDPEEYFRVDMEVKNVGNEKEYFSPSGLVVLDNQGHQFEEVYGGSLDTISEIYPGVTKEGYVLFEKIPDSTQTATLMFELGYDSDYDPYLYEYDMPLTE